MNMWVTGPVNSFKDGIQPMSALLETDWMPYTFTMNWQVTRKRKWIRFEKGEPVAQVFPVPRGVVDDAEPELRQAEERRCTERNSFGVAQVQAGFHRIIESP